MDSIHHCNHIVFTRKTSKDKNAPDENLLIAQNLYEDTIKLELGSELDDVSSSKIRENIDRGRYISNLIDHCASGLSMSMEFIFVSRSIRNYSLQKPLWQKQSRLEKSFQKTGIFFLAMPGFLHTEAVQSR